MCDCSCPKPSFIENPAQVAFAGFETRFPESYANGFRTGVNWKWNHLPGGPYRYQGTKLLAMRESDELKYQNWHLGFKEGLALRLANDCVFAKWWEANSNKMMHSGLYEAPEELALAA